MELLVDGIIVWLIEVIYLAVPTVLLVILVGSFTLVTGVSTSTGVAPMARPEGALAGLLLILVLLFVVVVAGYLLPAALGNFARTGELKAAFDLRTVAAGAFSGDYLLAIILIIGVSIVLGAIGGLLMLVLVGIFVLFYLQIVIYHLIGQGFARGLDLEPSTATPTGGD